MTTLQNVSTATEEAFKAFCAAEGLKAEFTRSGRDPYQVVNIEGFGQPGEGPIRAALADTSIKDHIELGVPTALRDLAARAHLKLDI